MDDLDRKILALLAMNARMPVKELAEKVGADQSRCLQPHPQAGNGRHHQRLYRDAQPPV